MNIFYRFFPLAMGIICHENEDNWKWFLKNLKKMIQEDHQLVFMSDRHQGLILGVGNVFLLCFIVIVINIWNKIFFQR